jgi:cytochrome c peroxidase
LSWTRTGKAKRRWRPSCRGRRSPRDGGRAEGWIKTFSLRGINDSPPYFHDGRLPTLENTAEFFNLLFDLKLSKQEKADLVAFMRAL